MTIEIAKTLIIQTNRLEKLVASKQEKSIALLQIAELATLVRSDKERERDHIRCSLSSSGVGGSSNSIGVVPRAGPEISKARGGTKILGPSYYIFFFTV
jgi:hypothetical protein